MKEEDIPQNPAEVVNGINCYYTWPQDKKDRYNRWLAYNDLDIYPRPIRSDNEMHADVLFCPKHDEAFDAVNSLCPECFSQEQFDEYRELRKEFMSDSGWIDDGSFIGKTTDWMKKFFSAELPHSEVLTTKVIPIRAGTEVKAGDAMGLVEDLEKHYRKTYNLTSEMYKALGITVPTLDDISEMPPVNVMPYDEHPVVDLEDHSISVADCQHDISKPIEVKPHERTGQHIEILSPNGCGYGHLYDFKGSHLRCLGIDQEIGGYHFKWGGICIRIGEDEIEKGHARWVEQEATPKQGVGGWIEIVDVKKLYGGPYNSASGEINHPDYPVDNGLRFQCDSVDTADDKDYTTFEFNCGGIWAKHIEAGYARWVDAPSEEQFVSQDGALPPPSNYNLGKDQNFGIYGPGAGVRSLKAGRVDAPSEGN